MKKNIKSDNMNIPYDNEEYNLIENSDTIENTFWDCKDEESSIDEHYNDII